MKDSRFRGWKDVFSFTFRQMTKNTGYRAITLVIGVLLVAVIMLVMVLTGKPEEDGAIEKTDMQQVYVMDTYGVDYGMMFASMGKEAFSEVSFTRVESRSQAIEAAKGELLAYMIVETTYEEGAFKMEAILPENSTADEGEAEGLLGAMAEAFEYAKVGIAGLTAEQSMAVMMPIMADRGKIGEDHSIGAMLVKLLAPMVFGLILYMMFLFYGQNVSREISVEKVSKLTETLLTSIKPYAMITGKVLAVTVAGVIQFFFWVACALIGLFAGNAVTKAVYPGYQSFIGNAIDFVRETFSTSAFSPVAVILAAITFIVGFLFYCVLAGFAGSLVSKPEDTAAVQGIFTFPILISFFACYFGVLLEKEGLITATRFIPFSIPFGVPVDLITGAISILQGIVSLLILLVFTFLFIIFSARVYKGMILYNGQKMNLKKLVLLVKEQK